MSYIIFKYIITAGLIVLISELAKVSDKIGALTSALPLVTITVLFWLFFEKGKIAKHTIESFHFKDEIQRFRAELSFNNHQPINNTIN